MSKRYIDTEEAEKNIRKFLDIQPSELVPRICKKVEDIAVNAVKLTPAADVVEVVRCRDCKYYKAYEPPIEDFDGVCNVNEIECDRDFYCGYGKRSEDDGT